METDILQDRNINQDEAMKKAVEVVTRAYAARVWWADVRDIHQEAWVGVLLARKTWRPEKAAPFYWYVYRAAMLTVRDYVWRQSAPVTGPRGRAEKLAGLHRAPIERAEKLAAPTALEIMQAREWWDGICDRVDQAFDCLGSGDATLARAALIDLEPQAAVAERLAVPLTAVRSAAYKARKMLKSDQDLRYMAAGAM